MTRSNLPFNLAPKALLAFLYPFIATLVAVATTWVVQGTFDGAALRTGVAGLLASGLALLGAYVGKPADAAVTIGPANDELLSPSAVTGLDAEHAPQPEKPQDA